MTLEDSFPFSVAVPDDLSWSQELVRAFGPAGGIWCVADDGATIRFRDHDDAECLRKVLLIGGKRVSPD